MIALKSLREYWEGMIGRVDGLKSVVPLTVEANMADKVGKVKEEQAPTLFYLPPTASGKGNNPDAFGEDNMCVIFVMQKYNPRTSTSAEVLEDVQPVVEALKAKIIEDSSRPCHFLKADISTISTLPETEFFGNWAGWSIGFTTKSY